MTDIDAWAAWVVWSWDWNPIVEGIFPTELDALRYLNDLGYPAKVTQVRPGDAREQLK